jgi:hypothetical protein
MLSFISFGKLPFIYIKRRIRPREAYKVAKKAFVTGVWITFKLNSIAGLLSWDH